MNKNGTYEEKRYEQLLVMESWCKEIEEEQRNIIISEALNYCSYYENLEVLGYLITKRRLFLIARSRRVLFDKILTVFYNQVAKGIAAYKKINGGYKHELVLVNDTHKLFRKYPFYNKYIQKIIIGQQINLPYYDPHLVRLKDQIHNYNYCSALDYAGGKSPVIVHIKSRKY